MLHLYGTVPVRATFVLPLAISHRATGQFGTFLSATVPVLAGGLGSITDIDLKIGREYAYRGQRRGFFSASCAAPAGFPAPSSPSPAAASTSPTAGSSTPPSPATATSASAHPPGSESEAADAALVPAEVVGELVAQGPLDLAGEQLAVVAEVALEGVAVDHDPVLVAFAGDAVAEVLAVGVVLGAEVGDDDRDLSSTFWNSSGSASIASATSDSNSSGSAVSSAIAQR